MKENVKQLQQHLEETGELAQDLMKIRLALQKENKFLKIDVNTLTKELQSERKRLDDYAEKLKTIKSFVIECDADERAIQPYEILDIINR
jgi:cob(I)alamin adenosyltransferase